MSTVISLTKTEHTTARMTLLREPHWRHHDGEFDFHLRSGEQFSDPAQKTVYSVIRKLGSGSAGTTYSAVVGSFTKQQIRDGKMRATHVLKVHDVSRGETPAQLEQRARHEFEISRFIETAGKASDGKFCGVDAVCALAFFVDADTQSVVTVFPYENAIDLQSFMQKELYGSFGESAVEYKRQVLEISRLLFKAVRNLNAVGLYHRDIKPDNVIVSFFYSNEDGPLVPRIRSLKLIDFELSCALVEPAFQRALELIAAKKKTPLLLESLTCALPTNKDRYVYFCNPTFRDPLSGSGDRTNSQPAQFQFTRDEAREKWRFFEMFSCAIVAQLLCDPDQNEDALVSPELQANMGVPKIRQTKRMPDGLFDILQEMTGPLSKRRGLADYAIQINYLLTSLED